MSVGTLLDTHAIERRPKCFYRNAPTGCIICSSTMMRGTGGRCQRGTRYKTDAIRFMREFKQSASTWRKSIPPKQFSEIILESISRTHAAGTVTMYKGTLNRFAEVIGESFPIGKISPFHWDAYRNKRLKEGVKPVTVNIETRCLRASLNIAQRWG